MEWRPTAWSNDRAWRVHQAAILGGLPVTLAGLGFNLLAAILSAEDNPNSTALNWLWGFGWMFIGAGFLLFGLMWLTRHAEQPRPYVVRIRIPRSLTYEDLDARPAPWAWVLKEVWLNNESDEHVVLEFSLPSETNPLGVYPYRTFYRQHRATLKDQYFSNPRHLGPRTNGEADLPFMTHRGQYAASADSYTQLQVLVNPPDGDKHLVPIPTPTNGTVISGFVNSPSIARTQELPTDTAS